MYNNINEELLNKIVKKNPEKHKNFNKGIRRNKNHDRPNIWRPDFIRDIEKILYCPYYNRYSDKTQVFSFYKNDDITRRALHVQLVSRIAKNIGRMLDLDLDLIEAISIGHDIGHTPFGHAGEAVLNEIYNYNTGRYFFHNVQSVRVLDKIFNYNITLQTLDGILCHNGEAELQCYRPKTLTDFNEFDKNFEDCCTDKDASLRMIPSTLEGCVVRISDIIAYLGKDRQDCDIANIEIYKDYDNKGKIGTFNAEMINNLIVNIVENSYGKDYIALDKHYFEDLKLAKQENYRLIYKNKTVGSLVEKIKPMYERIYKKCLWDLEQKNTSSLIYTHHIEYLKNRSRYYEDNNYLDTEKNQIVVDYIASMTDTYFSELYGFYFPKEKDKIKYISYFD